MGARESLNGRKNKARRKEKNGEKSPWGQCLTRPVPNGRRRSVFWLVPENLCFSGTNQKTERQDNSLLTMFYKQNLFQADTHLRRIKTKHSFLSGRICRKKFEVLLYEMWKEGSAILILIVRALVVVKNVLLLLRQETQYPYILRASSPFGG